MEGGLESSNVELLGIAIRWVKPVGFLIASQAACHRYGALRMRRV